MKPLTKPGVHLVASPTTSHREMKLKAKKKKKSLNVDIELRAFLFFLTKPNKFSPHLGISGQNLLQVVFPTDPVVIAQKAHV